MCVQVASTVSLRTRHEVGGGAGIHEEKTTYPNFHGLLMLIVGGGQPWALKHFQVRYENTLAAECAFSICDGSVMYKMRSH